MVSKVGFEVELAPTEFVTALARQTPGTTRRSRSAGRDASTRTATSTSSSTPRARSTTQRLRRTRIVDLTLDNARKAASLKARMTLYAVRMRSCSAQCRSSTSGTQSDRDGGTEQGRRRADLRRRPDPAPTSPATRAKDSEDERRSWAASSSARRGAALIVVVPGERSRLRRASGRCPATRRSRSARRTATRQVARRRSAQKYGLDEPLPVQYVRWRRARAPGRPRHRPAELPVAETIVTRIPITLELAGPGDPDRDRDRDPRRRDRGRAARQGVRLRRRRRSRWSGCRCRILARADDDHRLRRRTSAGCPPAATSRSARTRSGTSQHLLMPAIVLGTGLSAVLMRQMRSSMLDVALRRLRADRAREGAVRVVRSSAGTRCGTA